MNLQENIKKILREEVRRKLIQEQTTNTPKNATYVVSNNYSLSSDSFADGDLVIPKGTTFTAHQSGYFNNGKVESSKFWASVDKVVGADGYTGKGGKLTYSTIFYCGGENQGKFWDVSKRSWFTDEKKTLSNILLKNVCFKANQDYWAIQNKDKWDAQKQKKDESELAKDSPYVDAKGNKVLYYKSTDFKKNNDFFASQGLDVRVMEGNPSNPNHHYNLMALWNIRKITEYQLNNYGWVAGKGSNQCLQIGLSELGNVKMKSKMISKYNLALANEIKNDQSPLYTEITTKVKPPYANFVLADFYFKFTNLVNDIKANYNRNETYYFPEGVYNFMGTYYGSLNVSQITKNFSSYSKPGCKGGGLTPDQQKKVLSVLSFASAFIPVVGPFIAAGLGMTEAGISYSQGNKEEAAIGFILSAIPLAAEIPGLKNVGQAVMKQIGGKILSKVPLSSYESEVVSYIGKNKAAVEEVTTKWFANNSKNEVVKHIADTAKDKGEEWLEDKIKEKVGLSIPVSKAGVKRLGQNQIKTATTNTIKKVMA